MKHLTEPVLHHTKYYWVTLNFFLVYLPTLLTTIVLGSILVQMDKYEATLRKSSINLSQNNSTLTISIKYRRHIVKILVTYLLTSFICWTPLQFTIIYRHFRTNPVIAPWFFELNFFAEVSASLSAALDPIIFGFLSQPFRRLVSKFVVVFN